MPSRECAICGAAEPCNVLDPCDKREAYDALAQKRGTTEEELRARRRGWAAESRDGAERDVPSKDGA